MFPDKINVPLLRKVVSSALFKIEGADRKTLKALEGEVFTRLRQRQELKGDFFDLLKSKPSRVWVLSPIEQEFWTEFHRAINDAIVAYSTYTEIEKELNSTFGAYGGFPDTTEPSVDGVTVSPIREYIIPTEDEILAKISAVEKACLDSLRDAQANITELISSTREAVATSQRALLARQVPLPEQRHRAPTTEAETQDRIN